MTAATPLSRAVSALHRFMYAWSSSISNCTAPRQDYAVAAVTGLIALSNGIEILARERPPC
jgi:hypothetical protein